MEPQGRGNIPALHTPERNKRLGLRKTTLESRVHVQTVGLNAETTTSRHRAKGELFLLTFPLIGLLRFCDLPGAGTITRSRVVLPSVACRNPLETPLRRNVAGVKGAVIRCCYQPAS